MIFDTRVEICIEEFEPFCADEAMSEKFLVTDPEKLERISMLLIVFDEGSVSKILKHYTVETSHVVGIGHSMDSLVLRTVFSDFDAHHGDRLTFRAIPVPPNIILKYEPTRNLGACMAITMHDRVQRDDDVPPPAAAAAAAAKKKRRNNAPPTELRRDIPRETEIDALWDVIDGAMKKIFVRDSEGLRAARNSVLYELIRSPSVPKAYAMILLDRV
jgi:hypothetical protein